MNRRDFLRNSSLALFGFSILPPATTYQRIYRAVSIEKPSIHPRLEIRLLCPPFWIKSYTFDTKTNTYIERTTHNIANSIVNFDTTQLLFNSPYGYQTIQVNPIITKKI